MIARGWTGVGITLAISGWLAAACAPAPSSPMDSPVADLPPPAPAQVSPRIPGLDGATPAPWSAGLRQAEAALGCPWNRSGFSRSCVAYARWLEVSDGHEGALLWRLMASKSPQVRALAAAALMARPTVPLAPGDVPRVLALAESETDEAVGGDVGGLVARIATSADRTSVLRMLRAHPVTSLRVALASELVVSGGPGWEEVTLSLAERDGLEVVRLAAMGALRFVDDGHVEKVCALWRARRLDPAVAIADEAALLLEIEPRCGDGVDAILSAARARLAQGQMTSALVRTLARLQARSSSQEQGGGILAALEAVALSDRADWPIRRAASEALLAADPSARGRLSASPQALDGLFDGPGPTGVVPP